jgi:hypothetical protein
MTGGNRSVPTRRPECRRTRENCQCRNDSEAYCPGQGRGVGHQADHGWRDEEPRASSQRDERYTVGGTHAWAVARRMEQGGKYGRCPDTNQREPDKSSDRSSYEQSDRQSQRSQCRAGTDHRHVSPPVHGAIGYQATTRHPGGEGGERQRR